MQTTGVSSGKTGAVPMPLAEPDSAIPEGADETATPLAKPPAATHKPIASSSAIPSILGEVC
jgi:hypothetical protein